MNVIMLHSVGNESTLNNPHLSLSLDHFEEFCKFLRKKKYETCFLQEWYMNAGLNGEQNNKKVALTFDDGYLDNWVFVYPLLKKYGLKGTIFVNPEFVDPGIEPRPNLHNVWDEAYDIGNLQKLGFLNWEEIREMDKSGVIDIQSHSMSHNFYFLSDRIIDIYTGQKEYDWIAWYLQPSQKPFYLTNDNSKLIPPAYPVFEFGRALGLRRYFPDQRLIEFAGNIIKSNPKKIDKKEVQTALLEKQSMWPGRYESDEEMESRYRYELFESKRILEHNLDKIINFLCWPGGGYTELSIKLSIEAGYLASTIASREKYKVIDNSGEYKRIQRFGMGSYMSFNGKSVLVNYPKYLVHRFKAHSGNMFYRNLTRLLKLFYMIRYSL